MVYHITKIVNNSPTSVVLTNPVAGRDRHLIAKNSLLAPPYPPKVEYLNEAIVSYETVMGKALNIYTAKNNWCFWDNGSSDHLVGLGEGEGSLKTFPIKVHPNMGAPKLELTIDESGMPSFSHSRHFLPLKVESQWKDGLRWYWCWAAVTVSIANYYDKKRNLKQCELANAAFFRPDCCKSLNCDSPLTAQKALELAGIQRESREGKASFEEIMTEIDLGRPISIVLQVWPGAHNVVISGYDNDDPDNPLIMVLNPDPLINNLIYFYKEFPESYGTLRNYTWEETHFTQPVR
jgi:hypothetical protein